MMTPPETANHKNDAWAFKLCRFVNMNEPWATILPVRRGHLLRKNIIVNVCVLVADDDISQCQSLHYYL